MDMNNSATIIQNAENYCAREGARMTDPRRYVLEILAKAKRCDDGI